MSVPSLDSMGHNFHIPDAKPYITWIIFIVIWSFPTIEYTYKTFYMYMCNHFVFSFNLPLFSLLQFLSVLLSLIASVAIASSW